jgi:6-phosphogluconate dehydrogenase
MVPAGRITEELITSLAARMQKGDIIVDGGNSNYKDSQRRAKELAERGIHFCDAGTSGGVWGLKNGYCLMVGGALEAYAFIEPILKALAPERGLMHTGPAGSGHYVKMVHNGIEYGLMTAYGEGFEILRTSPFRLSISPASPRSGARQRGAVLLLDLLAEARGRTRVGRHPRLQGGQWGGGWTQAATEQNVPAPAITLSQ